MIRSKFFSNTTDIAIGAGLWEPFASLASIYRLTLTLRFRGRRYRRRHGGLAHRVDVVQRQRPGKRWLGTTVDLVLVTSERGVEYS